LQVLVFKELNAKPPAGRILFYDVPFVARKDDRMPDYDETTVALVGEMLKVLDAEADATTMSYEDQLRAVEIGLTEALHTDTGEVEAPAPEDEQVMRQALGRLDPKNTDAELEYGDVLRRLLSAIDKELFKWTSGLVQPPGPSGDAQVALVENSPIPETMKVL
jgi:hypothetical protein